MLLQCHGFEVNVQDVHLDVHVDLGRAGGLLVQPPHQLQLLLKQLLFLAGHLKVRPISDQAYGENGNYVYVETTFNCSSSNWSSLLLPSSTSLELLGITTTDLPTRSPL